MNLENGNIIAALIFLVAMCTDIIDGYIARRYRQMTYLGQFLDPISDKIMTVSMCIMLTYYNIVTLYCTILVSVVTIIQYQFSLIEAERKLKHKYTKLNKYSGYISAILMFFLIGNIFVQCRLGFCIIIAVIDVAAFIEDVVKNKDVLKGKSI